MFAVSLITFALASPPSEPVRYYALIFGGEAKRTQPNTAHTFATFVKSTSTSCEAFTISWLPIQLPVRPFSQATPGRNYGLHETLDLYRDGRQALSLWGPYEIRAEFYEDAHAHWNLLNSGVVSYKVFDGGLTRRFGQSHCVHAITRCNPVLGEAAKPVLWYGELITRKVVNHMYEIHLFINPEITHEWLLDALDLRQYPLKRRMAREPLIRLK